MKPISTSKTWESSSIDEAKLLQFFTKKHAAAHGWKYQHLRTSLHSDLRLPAWQSNIWSQNSVLYIPFEGAHISTCHIFAPLMPKLGGGVHPAAKKHLSTSISKFPRNKALANTANKSQTTLCLEHQVKTNVIYTAYKPENNTRAT